MKNILITGANGQLGNEMRVLAEKHPAYTYFFTDVEELDICNEKAVMEFVQTNEIDCIVNCAAYTAVDKAEECIDLCDKLNHLAPGYLAKASCFDTNFYRLCFQRNQPSPLSRNRANMSCLSLRTHQTGRRRRSCAFLRTYHDYPNCMALLYFREQLCENNAPIGKRTGNIGRHIRPNRYTDLCPRLGSSHLCCHRKRNRTGNLPFQQRRSLLMVRLYESNSSHCRNHNLQSFTLAYPRLSNSCRTTQLLCVRQNENQRNLQT